MDSRHVGAIFQGNKTPGRAVYGHQTELSPDSAYLALYSSVRFPWPGGMYFANVSAQFSLSS